MIKYIKILIKQITPDSFWVFLLVYRRRIEWKGNQCVEFMRALPKLVGNILNSYGHLWHLLEYWFLAATKRNHFTMSEFKEGFSDHLLSKGEKYYLDDKSLQRIFDAYIKSKDDQVDQPIPYQIGGEWKHLIAYSYQELSAHIVSGNIAEARIILSNFAKDKVSLGLSACGNIKKNYFIHLKMLNDYNKSYPLWKSLTGLTNDCMLYPKIGNLHGLSHGKEIVSPTSFRASYFANRINELLFKKAVNSSITIAEIGGGYGGLAYFLFKNYPSFNCKYYNLDIPESNLLITFFLMSSFPEKHFVYMAKK